MFPFYTPWKQQKTIGFQHGNIDQKWVNQLKNKLFERNTMLYSEY